MRVVVSGIHLKITTTTNNNATDLMYVQFFTCPIFIILDLVPPSFSFVTKNHDLPSPVTPSNQHHPHSHDITVHLPPFPGHSVLEKQPQIREADVDDSPPPPSTSRSPLLETLQNHYGALMSAGNPMITAGLQQQTMLLPEDSDDHNDNESESSDNVYEIEDN